MNVNKQRSEKTQECTKISSDIPKHLASLAFPIRPQDMHTPRQSQSQSFQYALHTYFDFILVSAFVIAFIRRRSLVVVIVGATNDVFSQRLLPIGLIQEDVEMAGEGSDDDE